MPDEYSNTNTFRGAVFRQVDLTGATFRECDLTQVKILGSQIADLRVTGFDGEVGTVVVDDVDVTAFVAAELDARYPERVQLRSARTAADYRAMWDVVEPLWTETVARAERLPEAARNERVDDDWSFAETLRHLVFAVEVWIGRMMLGEEGPYHRLALPPTDYPADRRAEIGIDPDARPPFAEVVALHAESRAQVRRAVEALTDDELDQRRTATPTPVWGEESQSVGECLRVVMREHVEHRRFAERDLATLEAR